MTIATTGCIRIEPESFYDENLLRVMGLDGKTLRNARDTGQLRFKDMGGGKIIYKGEWVRSWLEGAEGKEAVR